MQLSDSSIHSFRSFIWDFYGSQKRLFAWRIKPEPYYVFVSEIMLQQTQTYRVAPKFDLFVDMFPNFYTLSQASLADVLFAWQGLGYNRRALALHDCAKRIVQEYNGIVPVSVETLQTFRGIGYATASSITAFAYNMPTIFIETNIRAVFIHSFFKDALQVSDKDILPLVEQTVDTDNPREWYYALMDYGVYLKKLHKNPSRRSAHHTKQSKFEGSDRQIRGALIRQLTLRGAMARDELLTALDKDPERVEKILDQLIKEGFMRLQNSVIEIM